jgi:hypothetical protein
MEYQNLVGALLTRHPSKWSELAEEYPNRIFRSIHHHAVSSLRLDWSGPVPVAKITPRNTLRAMIAAIQIDHWRQAKFRRCAKPGCWKVFEARGQNKIYCDDSMLASSSGQKLSAKEER